MRLKRNKPILLLTNIGQLVTMRSPRGRSGPRRGPDLREVGILQDAAVLSVAGKIVSVGNVREAMHDSWIRKNRRRITEIACEGRVVLPGFVDSHTHPVFISPRLVDFEERIAGAAYDEIAQAGGGIRSSVADVRSAGKTELSSGIVETLSKFLQHGTTTVEAKSGYGLNAGAELKSLQAIRDAAMQWPGTVVPTLLGAHVVPPEFRGQSDEYLKIVCDEMIPKAAKQKLAACVDVFCDRGAFTEEQSLRVLAAARKHRLATRAHVSQLTRTSLEGLLSTRPLSLDHLDFVDDHDVELITRSNTVATLVPGANYFLGLPEYAPARKLIDAGAAVALATDYNPGTSPTLNIQFVLSLACTQMKMHPSEAIAAATINGAWALGLGQCKGSIEAGKDADFAIYDAIDYREIAYWFGSNRCKQVIVGGEAIQL